MNAGCKHFALFVSELTGGGAQRRMLTLAHAFALCGHSVDLVVARAQEPVRRRASQLVKVVALDTPWARLPGLATRRGLWVPAAAPALARYLRRERPDVLLSTSTPANLASLWAVRLARVGTAVVVSQNVHLSEATGDRQVAWGPLVRELARHWYPRADAVIAISHGVAEDLAQLAGMLRKRITTIYNPVAVREMQQRARAPLDHPWFEAGGPPVLLAAGKLKIQKDFPTLIRAFSRVRALRPARLVILGDGEQRRRLERLVRRLGLAADVALPGFVDNPYAWMARASVFVLSSAWEGFSNVLCEALACGCPVVSTDCPSGPAEILDGGAYGPLVPVGDDRALADAILIVLKDPPDRERLRARAATFSVDAAVGRYLEVLLGACSESNR